jgi:hypothetical protein
MENDSWKIFGDACVGHKCMDTTVAQPVGGDVDIVVGITKLGEQVAGNTKLELQSFGYLPP